MALISLEGQMLCSSLKTGIARYAYNIIKNVIESESKHSFEIVYFDFLKRNNSRNKIIDILPKRGDFTVKGCNYMPYGIFARYHGMMKFLSYNSLAGSNADIYHFFSSFIPSNIKGKTILTVYDMVYSLFPETMNRVNYNIHRRYLKPSCKRADIIFTISQNSKREIAEHFRIPENKIVVTYCGIDKSMFFPRADFDYVNNKYGINGKYILYLGTLEPRKNIPTLLKAFKILSERIKGVKLVLAGGRGWMYDDIFKIVEDLKIEDRVVFTGYVDESDIPALYSRAEIFVFPSLYEGFGIPPLEAMACGTPVIASNASSLPEVVGDAGILLDPLDVDAFAYEMERLLTSESLKKEYSKKGLLQAEKFTWESSAAIVKAVYKSLE